MSHQISSTQPSTFFTDPGWWTEQMPGLDEVQPATTLEEALRTGRPLLLSRSLPVVSHASADDSPDFDASLALDVGELCRLLTDAEIMADVHPSGLTVVGAVLPESLELDHFQIHFPISFHYSVFVGSLTAIQATFTTLLMNRCVVLGDEGMPSVLADRVSVSGNWTFRECDFHQGVRFPGARIEGQAILRGCRLGEGGLAENGEEQDRDGDSLHGQEARVEGGCLFDGISTTGAVHVNNLETSAIFSIKDSRIGATFDAEHLRVKRGDLDMSNLEVATFVILRSAYVEGSIRCEGGVFGINANAGMLANNLNCSGDLEFGHGFRITSGCVLSGAKIGGSLSFAGATVGEDDQETCLVLDNLSAGGDLSFTERTHFRGVVRMHRGVVAGNFIMSDCRFSGRLQDGTQAGSSLLSAGVRVGGTFAISKCLIEGSVFASQYAIEGQGAVTDSIFMGKNAEGNSLVMDRLYAAATVQFSRVWLGGGFRAVAARIASQFVARDFDVRGMNQKGDSLDFARITVDSGIDFDGSCGFMGRIKLGGCTLGGLTHLSGRRVDHEGRHYPIGLDISVDASTVAGDLFVDAGGPRVRQMFMPLPPVKLTIDLPYSVGELHDAGPRLAAADVPDSISLSPEVAAFVAGESWRSAFRFGENEQFELYSRSGVIDPDELVLVKCSNFLSGILDLSSASVSRVFAVGGGMHLAMDDASIRTFQTLSEDEAVPFLASAVDTEVHLVRGALAERKVAVRWLRSADEHSPGTWHQFAQAFERTGRSEDARWLSYHAASEAARTGSGAARIGHFVNKCVTGHGYYPMRTAIWLVVVVALTALFVGSQSGSFRFSLPDTASQGEVVSTEPSEGGRCSRDSGSTSVICASSGAAAIFNPWSVAIGNTLPAVGSDGFARSQAVGSAVWAMLAFKLVSWILTALFLAGVSGLLRRR